MSFNEEPKKYSINVLMHTSVRNSSFISTFMAWALCQKIFISILLLIIVILKEW